AFILSAIKLKIGEIVRLHCQEEEYHSPQKIRTLYAQALYDVINAKLSISTPMNMNQIENETYKHAGQSFSPSVMLPT
ncbi:7517_t:CDS:1, partial [Paraglomus occultum]